MKHKQSIQGFLSGVLVTALLAGAALPAIAAGASIWVDTGVKVYVNDAPIDAGDTHGNPDAFIYNGTTYVAVAAVSKSLGENVKWEGNTKSVYIGKHAGSTTYLLDVCQPYEGKSYKLPSTISIAGTKYMHGLDLANHGGFAIFNLNGKYDSLEFSIGRIDNVGDKCDGILEIYLDGQLYDSIDIGWQDLPQTVRVPLNGALQLKLQMVGYGNMAHYGLCEMTVK